MCIQWNTIHRNNKIKRTTNTFYDINESSKTVFQGKKPDTKDHILYDPIYMKHLEQGNP